jgi:hypothetical protein
MYYVARFDKLGLGQVVEDRRAGPTSVHKAGRTEHRQVLTRVRQAAAQLLCQVADRVLAFAQNIQEHQALGVGEHPAHFRVQPIPLWISIALIVHLCLLPAPPVRPGGG